MILTEWVSILSNSAILWPVIENPLFGTIFSKCSILSRSLDCISWICFTLALLDWANRSKEPILKPWTMGYYSLSVSNLQWAEALSKIMAGPSILLSLDNSVNSWNQLTQSSALTTDKKNENSILFCRTVFDNETEFPVISECNKIDLNLHVKLHHNGKCVSLQKWFLHGRSAKLTRFDQHM